MNKLTRLAVGMGTLTVTCAGVMAQSAELSPAAALDAFVGKGICNGSVMGMGKEPSRATSGKYVAEKVLDGNWVVIHYNEESTSTNPKPFQVVQYVGYDSAKKRFVAVEVDNSGSGYSIGTSTGWKGDSFTLDNSSPGDTTSPAQRDVFTKSDSITSHTGLIRDKDGKWVKTDEITCHKG